MDNRRISWFVPPLILIIIIIAVNIVYYRKRSHSLKRIVIKQGNREYSQENQEKITEKNIVPLKESLPRAQKEEKKRPLVTKGKKFAIQIASFRRKKKALAFVDSLKKDNYQAYIVAKDLGDKGTWYRVRIGNFSSRSDADSTLKEVKTKYLQSFVTSYISP